MARTLDPFANIPFDPEVWIGAASSPAAAHATAESDRSLAAYRAKPSLVREHANIERATAQGGYGHRQLYELIQNGADALTTVPGGRIAVVLTDDALYCANEGSAIDVPGVEAILSSHVSMKRGAEIGRFGLGFKSVLGVSRCPSFFSRSACFGFDADVAANAIRSVVPDAERTPVLRFAQSLNPLEAAATDGTLRELMSWATTVVKLPRNERDSSWLSADMAAFPSGFLLFSPHVGSLILDDRGADTSRQIRVETDGTSFRLFDNGETEEWRVFSTVHRPSAEAKADGGELSDRDELPLIWAVPTAQTRRRRGSFWAFFPTEYEMTLSGILNAPWKTNEDRQNLLQGVFNNEMIDAAAALVVDSLGQLSASDDPASLLDVLPGRLDESPQWADRRLNTEIYRLASSAPVLPNMDGDLVAPTALSLHPAVATPEALAAWNSSPSRPLDWCHHSVFSRDRRARCERLFGNRVWAVAQLRHWLEALVHDSSSQASIAAIRAIDLLLPDPAKNDATYRFAEFILAEDDALVAPGAGRVFLRSDYVATGDVKFVHSDLTSHPDVLAALDRLGVRQVDAVNEFAKVVADGLRSVNWSLFWPLTRSVPRDIVQPMLAHMPAAPLQVLTRAGTFAPISLVLLPGTVVPTDASRDTAAVLDTDFHAPDLELLTGLGMSDRPAAGRGSLREPWFAKYRRDVDGPYQEALREKRGRPHDGYIVFDPAEFPGPLAAFSSLSPAGRAQFTKVLFDFPESLTKWTLAHKSRRDSYPVVQVASPVMWMLQNYALLSTSLGEQRLADVVGRGLQAFADVMPVATLSHALTSALNLPERVEDLTEHHWTLAFDNAQHLDFGNLEAGRVLYETAAFHTARPDRIVCAVGGEPALVEPAGVTAVTDPLEFDALNRAGMPVLLCSRSGAIDLVRVWGLRASVGQVSSEVAATPSSEVEMIVDAFPFMRAHLDDETLLLQRCSLIRVITSTSTGTQSEIVMQVLRDGVFYWTDDRTDADLLTMLATELQFPLTPSDIEREFSSRQSRARAALLERLRSAENINDKLLAIGGADALRRRLPADLLNSVEAFRGTLSPRDLAELIMAVHGLDALKAMTPELQHAGFDPPTRWAGNGAAIRYVAELGFPREFAGFEAARMSALLEVDGPIELRPLHDFQRLVSGQLKAVVDESARGLLSLPTGAGKTRVAVQALVEMMEANTTDPVLWVAQTVELCEQAVQTWAEVWRAIGPRRTLAISRLWSNNEADAIEDTTQVVVATISKLGHCIGAPEYDWLSKPRVVVIDEAHGSTTTSYTALLAWLDLGRGRTSRPLVGLTGTPFRGRSESAAEQLAARYGHRRIDAGAFDGDPHTVLQEMGVLARVRHRILGGADLDLTPDELDYLKRTNRLPPTVEERLGVDRDRNAALLDSIVALPAEWTILVFATSVTHAQTLAALLSLEGVPARAISAETAPAARRHYVEGFRAGDIRILTNYGVLTEGFDAPAVRAVYVGRPTFSPNRYQQMIGRGLRGPLNGGKEECLIVDVADNILQFGGDLAFRDYEHLWDTSRRTETTE